MRLHSLCFAVALAAGQLIGPASLGGQQPASSTLEASARSLGAKPPFVHCGSLRDNRGCRTTLQEGDVVVYSDSTGTIQSVQRTWRAFSGARWRRLRDSLFDAIRRDGGVENTCFPRNVTRVDFARSWTTSPTVKVLTGDLIDHQYALSLSVLTASSLSGCRESRETAAQRIKMETTADSLRLANLPALATPTNDFSVAYRPAGRMVTTPTAVRRAVRSLVQAERERWLRNHEPVPESDLFGPIYRIRAPEGRYLFVFERRFPLGDDDYCLIMFDRVTGAVTADPEIISGRWMSDDSGSGSLLRRPLASFDDLDRDGHPELVVEEMVHNGTSYTGVVYHYLEIRADLALRPVLNVEARVSWNAPDGEGIITRKLTKLGGDSLILTSVFEPKSGSPRPIGTVTLLRDRRTLTYQVGKRQSVDPTFAPWLVAISEEGQALFWPTPRN